MKTTAGLLGRTPFAALTVAALGLGTASAFASPANPQETQRACDRYSCTRECVRAFGPDVTAYCSGGSCFCEPG